MNNPAAALTGTNGEQVALTDVSASAVLRDLLGEVTVVQTYRNDESINIEAVYTFPLPLDGVLLELQVEIGGRVLKGVVVEKNAAEEQYEDAIDSGDSAVMLQVIEPGLYTMNIGNLLPSETATITFIYGIVYRWTGDCLRFFLPTTIAPRYGKSPHSPHQAPESSLMVENQFSLQVEIFGSLQDGQFTCPSHDVELVRSEERVLISLRKAKAVMDRDFILNIKAPQATRSFVQCGADGEGATALASFQPFFPGLHQPRSLNLAIVIDCSGSMQGDSMAQAKQALEGILDALHQNDLITLIAFGSTTSLLAQQPLRCKKTNLEMAKSFASQLDANMGGTEIGLALDTTYTTLGDSGPADIFLVTDGEVSSWAYVVPKAKLSGHRFFTVGVGSSVAEAFVRGLATSTGGECELVSPREGMADRIVRHFERMRTPRAKRIAISWPEGARDLAPRNLGAVFEGDTVIVSACFDQPSITGNVALEIDTETGDTIRLELPISMQPAAEAERVFSTISRLAAAARLKEMEEQEVARTAIRYRLVSRCTNWLVIAERSDDEKAQELPELRKVPQTLAAGWGGTGKVLACASAAPRFSMSDLDVCESVEIRSFSHTSKMGTSKENFPANLPVPIRNLIDLIEEQPGRLNEATALDLLEESTLLSEFRYLFARADDLGLNIQVLAVIVLAELLSGRLRKHLSDEACSTAKGLQNYANRATEALREVGRQGSSFARVVSQSLGHEVFRPKVAQATIEVIERFAKINDLIEELRDQVRSITPRRKLW